MLEVDFAKFSNARIWINETPDVPPISTSTLEHILSASTFQFASVVSATLEVAIPTGSRIIYGLLGATFSLQSGTSNLHISTSVYDADPIPFLNSLAVQPDTATIGLQPQYANILHASFLKNIDLHTLSPGTLHFSHAACADIGSTADIFIKIATAIIHLFSHDFPENRTKWVSWLTTHFHNE